jgi:hypothetical protein
VPLGLISPRQHGVQRTSPKDSLSRVYPLEVQAGPLMVLQNAHRTRSRSASVHNEQLRTLGLLVTLLLGIIRATHPQRHLFLHPNTVARHRHLLSHKLPHPCCNCSIFSRLTISRRLCMDIGRSPFAFRWHREIIQDDSSIHATRPR